MGQFTLVGMLLGLLHPVNVAVRQRSGEISPLQVSANCTAFSLSESNESNYSVQKLTVGRMGLVSSLASLYVCTRRSPGSHALQGG